MKHIYIYIHIKIIFALLLCCLPVAADDAEALDGLQKLLKPYRDFQAELHRTDESGEVLVSKLWFRAPDRYRLELDDDTLIISDGTTRVLYEPDLEQAVYEPANQTVGTLPLLVFGAKKKDLEDEYTIAMQQLDSGEVSYSITNAESGALVLNLYFSNEQPTRLSWEDTLKNLIELRIEALSDEKPENSQFSFQHPEGVKALHLGASPVRVGSE